MKVADLDPGARVGDRYVVVSLLGAGGMGSVYLARDERDGREVALKILRGQVSGSERATRRLKREARAASGLDPSRVAPVYDVGETSEGVVYLAMEYVRGETLRERLGAGALEVRDALRIVREIATTLASAHEKGLVHRDVKPDNVMIASDDRVVLLDFGIAKEMERDGDPGQQSTQITVEGTMLGTPAYVAPEQAVGGEIGPAADQFALGVTAFELLTGRLPWTATDPARVLAQVLGARPTAASAEDAKLFVFEAALDRAMGKEPLGRFSSVTAFASALEAAERGEPSAPTSENLLRSPVGATLDEVGAQAREAGAPLAAPAHAISQRLARRSPRRWVAASAVALLVAAPMAYVAQRARVAARPPAVNASIASGCISNAACSREHDGGAWRCDAERHACVDIESVDCKAYAEPGDLQRDDTVWIGGMFPRSTEPDWDVEVRGADLARSDFAMALGSSALRAGELHAPPIALAICDEGADPVRAARHLVDDVHVPAVIGFRNSKSALATIPSVFLPAKTLSVLSLAQGAGLTDIPELAGAPRLVWRTTLDNDDKTEVLSAIVSDFLEPRARAEKGGLGDRPMRVAVVRHTAVAQELSDALFRGIRFNGKEALENGENFRQFVVGSSQEPTTSESVRGLVAFAPNVVIDAMEDGFVSNVLLPLEQQWHSGPRPSYLVGSYFVPGVLDFIGTDIRRRRRFFGSSNVSSSRVNAELVFHYNYKFPEQAVTATTAPEPSYDAFYLLAYATYAGGAQRVTGPAIASGFERLLPPGRKIDVGPAGIFDAFKALRSGGRIDLEGAIGSLNFDVSRGEAPISYAVLCCGVDETGRAAGSVESGIVYNPVTKRLEGTPTCP